MSRSPAPSRRTQAARREEAETRLKRAAIDLLAEKGYDGFSLSQVGEAAGYSRGLPAHYFGKKEDLLADVAREIVDGYYRGLSADSDSSGLFGIERKIRAYGQGLGTLDTKALNILISEAQINNVVREAVESLNARGLGNLVAELEEGKRIGNVAADADTMSFSRVIYAFLRGMMQFSMFDDHFDSVPMCDAFIAMLRGQIGVAETFESPSKGQQEVAAPGALA